MASIISRFCCSKSVSFSAIAAPISARRLLCASKLSRSADCFPALPASSFSRAAMLWASSFLRASLSAARASSRVRSAIRFSIRSWNTRDSPDFASTPEESVSSLFCNSLIAPEIARSRSSCSAQPAARLCSSTALVSIWPVSWVNVLERPVSLSFSLSY